MAGPYRLVGWNRQKRIYDLVLVGGVLFYLVTFAAVSLAVRPRITVETLLIRGFGTLAFLLLTLTLSIGPLVRLQPRLSPLLYNRRHLGVTTFLAALIHALLSLVQFHFWGDLSPLVSLLVSNGSYSDLAFFPFQILGLLALLILFLMAATSHDFWLYTLSPVVWKCLHMAVYVAYALLVGHIALGVLQAERHPGLVFMLTVSVAWLAGLHLVTGWRERSGDRARASVESEAGEWVDAGPADSIADGKARVVRVGGERVAVFRHQDRLYGLGNVCAHQGGPLGEGRVIDGCAVCPWHGYEYRLESGTSPPPFKERVPVHRLRLAGDRVEVEARPAPEGATVEPLELERGAVEEETARHPPTPFYIGYRPQAPGAIASTSRRAAALIVVLAAGLAAALAAWQQPFSRGVFEFGVETTLVGTLATEPLPHLMVENDEEDPSGYLLVLLGKHGFTTDLVTGTRVRVTGPLIHNHLGRMVEVHEVSALGPSPAPLPPLTEFGRQALSGEIVDAKCFLGVMKPGRKKTHRACASLCIRGGIPAMLLTVEGDPQPRGLVLVSDRSGSVGSRLLDRVAEPVEVEGQVIRRADLWFLRADPDSIRRLHPAAEPTAAP